MLDTSHKEFEITIKLRVSGDVADMVVPEHVASNIESDLIGDKYSDGKTIADAVSEVELWGEYYGDHEDVWTVFGDGEFTVEAVEVEPEEEETINVEGVVMEYDKVNKNGRIYPAPISFSIYHDDGDTEIIESSVLNEKNEFVFLGFNDKIHPYFLKVIKWVDVMLESKGIYLNRKTYKTVDGIGEAPNGWWDDPEKINLPNEMKLSSDGNIYFHAQDSEMGRGGAILMKMSPDKKTKEILMSDHRDNVRDMLYHEFVPEMGVDVVRIKVKDITKISVG